ncbi:ankyrin repeat-containing domain protein [Xylariomycetidae sp. FL0641]|nr:ankyrin repeat-containing domain protein [Xylariomycetidae sp. FL0641]
MPSILDLPNETLSLVAENVPDGLLDVTGLHNLALTCKRLSAPAVRILYKAGVAINPGHLLCWAVVNNQEGTLRLALEYGAHADNKWESPGFGDWSQDMPRIMFQEPPSLSSGQLDRLLYSQWSPRRPRWCLGGTSIRLNAEPQQRCVEDWRAFFQWCTADFNAMQVATVLGAYDLLEILVQDFRKSSDQDLVFKGQYWTPLHIAIRMQDLGMANLLLSHGFPTSHKGFAPSMLNDFFQLFSTTRNRSTVLHAACQEGWLPFVKHLVEKVPGIDLNAYDSAGNSPLVYAYLNEHLDCMDYLLKKGAQLLHEVIPHRRVEELEPFDWMHQYFHPDALVVLSRHGFDIRESLFENDDGHLMERVLGVVVEYEPPFLDNIRFKKINPMLSQTRRLVAHLFKKHQDFLKFPHLTARGRFAAQQKALMHAIEAINVEVVQVLCEVYEYRGYLDSHGETCNNAKRRPLREPKLKGFHGSDMVETPLTLACQGYRCTHGKSTVKMVSSLIASGHEDSPNAEGLTPLHCACNILGPSKYTNTIIRMLVEDGADIKAQSGSDDPNIPETPLDAVVAKQSRGMLKAMAWAKRTSPQGLLDGAGKELLEEEMAFLRTRKGDLDEAFLNDDTTMERIREIFSIILSHNVNNDSDDNDSDDNDSDDNDSDGNDSYDLTSVTSVEEDMDEESSDHSSDFNEELDMDGSGVEPLSDEEADDGSTSLAEDEDMDDGSDILSGDT